MVIYNALVIVCIWAEYTLQDDHVVFRPVALLSIRAVIMVIKDSLFTVTYPGSSLLFELYTGHKHPMRWGWKAATAHTPSNIASCWCHFNLNIFFFLIFFRSSLFCHVWFLFSFFFLTFLSLYQWAPHSAQLELMQPTTHTLLYSSLALYSYIIRNSIVD